MSKIRHELLVYIMCRYFDALRSPSVQIWTYPSGAAMKTLHCWETGKQSVYSRHWNRLRIMDNISGWGSEITWQWGRFGIHVGSLLAFSCIYIYTRTAYDFIERRSGDSGGIVPVFTANSVYALPCAGAAEMEKETAKALKHWDDSLQLQNNRFTSRTPLDQVDYVQQTLRLECVSFVLLGGFQPFLGVVPFFFQLRKEQNGNSRLKFQHVTTKITSPGMPVRK